MPEIPPNLISGGRDENTSVGQLNEESAFMNSKFLGVCAFAQNEENKNTIKNLFILLQQHNRWIKSISAKLFAINGQAAAIVHTQFHA